jgi:hypothetical protein
MDVSQNGQTKQVIALYHTYKRSSAAGFGTEYQPPPVSCSTRSCSIRLETYTIKVRVQISVPSGWEAVYVVVMNGDYAFGLELYADLN